MLIKIENGQKIITHESGHIDTYSISDCEINRDTTAAQIERLNSQLIEQNLEISEMQNSLST